MKYSEAKQGRIFVLRLENGEIVREVIEQYFIQEYALFPFAPAHKNPQNHKQRPRLLLKAAATLIFAAVIVGGIFSCQANQQYQQGLRQYVVLADFDHAIRLGEMEKTFARNEVSIHIDKIISNPGRTMLLGQKENKIVNLWEIIEEHDIALVKANDYQNNVIRISDGTLLAIEKVQNRIILRDFLTDHERMILEGHTADVTYVAFSATVQILASGSKDNTIKLWDLSTGKNLATLSPYSGKSFTWSEMGTNIAFSPDGQKIASVSHEKSMTIWSVPEGKEIANLEGHSYPVKRIVFSPDGTQIASVGSTGVFGEYCELKLWNIANKTCYLTKNNNEEPHTFLFHNVIFSPDNAMIASGGSFPVLWDRFHRYQIPLMGLYGDPSLENLSFEMSSIESLMFDQESKFLVLIGRSENGWEALFYNVGAVNYATKKCSTSMDAGNPLL